MSQVAARNVAVLLALTSFAPASMAVEYCVTCAGPDAAYRCTVEGTPPGAGKDARAQFICITQLASEGGHDSCSVSRGAALPCPGETKVVSAPIDELPGKSAAITDPATEPAAAPEAATDAEGQAGAVPAVEGAPAKKQKPPRTVEELAKQTVQSSKEGLQKAGDAVSGTAKSAGDGIGKAGSAVGNAAKKTWTCLTSLFSEC